MIYSVFDRVLFNNQIFNARSFDCGIKAAKKIWTFKVQIILESEIFNSEYQFEISFFKIMKKKF